MATCTTVSRRAFFAASAQGLAALSLRGAPAEKARIGLVASTHSKLAQPSSLEDPLDYPRVRDMVWKAIEYGRPRAGSLEAKIKPGSWVVIKPNIGSLPPRQSYTIGDTMDLRVAKAVLEYVAAKSRAGRITVAEGGTYRRVGDPATDDVMLQNGVHVDCAPTPGTSSPDSKGPSGTCSRKPAPTYPGKKFDYVDLAYDPVRDPSGQFRWMDVPRSPNGVGAFGEKKVYVPANTIVNCDFLISVPVIKVHNGCGVTACLKNYVGTGPRIVYAPQGTFSNTNLHRDHSLEGRVDSFITDLAAFHPPDYCVVDGIRGLQYYEHLINIPDQMIRSNMVLAGEDPVAIDALVATLMGFQPSDIEYLHMASQRRMGVMDLGTRMWPATTRARFRRRWAKPRELVRTLQPAVAADPGRFGRYEDLGALHGARRHAALQQVAAACLRCRRLQIRRAGNGRRQPEGFPVGGRARPIDGVSEWRKGNGRAGRHALPHRAVPKARRVAFRREPAGIRAKAGFRAGGPERAAGGARERRRHGGRHPLYRLNLPACAQIARSLHVAVGKRQERRPVR